MKRALGLDVIRGLAVILVLFRHSTFEGVLQHAGWIGVDLFFVLSGFLVSGLVFTEFKATGDFSFRRFFIRRGLKIYPAFYFFLLVSLLVNYFEHGLTYEPRLILAEVFFIQSYLPHVWTHTWSVAVEEHFYLALGLIALWKVKSLANVRYHRLLWYLIAALLVVFMIRFFVCYPKRQRDEFAFFSTHLRMDGIIVGVMVAYIYHFTGWITTFVKYRIPLMMLSVLLISPAFFIKGGGFLMNTFGLTLLNLGFGTLVLFTATQSNLIPKGPSKTWLIVSAPIRFVGIHSYSIYLWHLFVLQECNRLQLHNTLANVVYIMLSLIVGVLVSYLIERPFLRLRESSLIYGKKTSAQS